MAQNLRSIHTLLARELSLEETGRVSGGDDPCGDGATDVSTEPTVCDTAGSRPWDTGDCDDDGSWDYHCD